jgi:hypothetical protein
MNLGIPMTMISLFVNQKIKNAVIPAIFIHLSEADSYNTVLILLLIE